MDLRSLAGVVADWERDGRLDPRRCFVVTGSAGGPATAAAPATDGALRVGRRDPWGGIVVEAWALGEGWGVERTYGADEEEAAAGYAFDRMADLVAASHWGEESWTRWQAEVRSGDVLRSALLLLAPELDRRADRWVVAAALTRLGFGPGRACWIEGVTDEPPPDEVLQLRRRNGAWEVGIEERGSFRSTHVFGDEGDACRELFRQVVGSAVVRLGPGPRADEGGEHPSGPPWASVTEPHRTALLGAVRAVLLALEAPDLPR